MEEHYIPNDISPDIITDKSGRTALFISIMNSWTFYELPQYLEKKQMVDSMQKSFQEVKIMFMWKNCGSIDLQNSFNLLRF